MITLSASLAVASNGPVGSKGRITGSGSGEQIRAIEQAYADTALDTQPASADAVEGIAALRARAPRQDTEIAELTSVNASLRGELEARERELATLTKEYGEARVVVQSMQEAITRIEDLLGTVMEERSQLQERLRAAEEQLVEVSGQRDAMRRVEVGLRGQLVQLKGEVARLQTHRESTQLWLKDWVLGSVEALENLVDETGVDVDKLLARAANELPLGQGGPLQVVTPDELGSAQAPSAGDAISSDIQRLALLQRIARALPLASPLDQFYVTSPYGKRLDPFAKTWAYHGGIDLGAPRGSQVLATAPGEVTFAGSAGPYGNMVEVDHGMGVVTRYAHLKSVDVEVGEVVEFRRNLGMMGNTGRSTSRHVHYEIRIDDRPFDPARFLDAGRLMVGIFDGSGHQEAR